MKNSNPENETTKSKVKDESSEDSEYDVEYDKELYEEIEMRDVKIQTIISIDTKSEWPPKNSEISTQTVEEKNVKSVQTQTEKDINLENIQTQTENLNLKNTQTQTEEDIKIDDSLETKNRYLWESMERNEWDEDSYYDSMIKKYSENINSIGKDPKNDVEFIQPEEKTLEEKVDEVNKRSETWESYFEKKGGWIYWLWLVFCFIFGGSVYINKMYMKYMKNSKFIRDYDEWARNKYLLSMAGCNFMRFPTTEQLLNMMMYKNSIWTSLSFAAFIYIFKRYQKYINNNIRNPYVVRYRGIFLNNFIFFWRRFF